MGGGMGGGAGGMGRDLRIDLPFILVRLFNIYRVPGYIVWIR